MHEVSVTTWNLDGAGHRGQGTGKRREWRRLLTSFKLFVELWGNRTSI